MTEAQRMFLSCGITLMLAGLITNQKSMFSVGLCMAVFSLINYIVEKL